MGLYTILTSHILHTQLLLELCYVPEVSLDVKIQHILGGIVRVMIPGRHILKTTSAFTQQHKQIWQQLRAILANICC